MKFTYGRQDMKTLEMAERSGFLLANGLGGYMALTAAFSVNRCDAGVLVAARTAPNDRVCLVHRLCEEMTVGEEKAYLSAQGFADGAQEDGYRHLASFSHEHTPQWVYGFSGVQVTRSAAMAYGRNAAAVVYEIANRSGEACSLRVTPFLRFTPKEQPMEKGFAPALEDGCVKANGLTLHIGTNGTVRALKPAYEALAYPEDKKDGRDDHGGCAACFAIEITVPAGQSQSLSVIFSDSACDMTAQQMLDAQKARARQLEADCGLHDPVARQLALAADAYITRRDSTQGKTIIAGYPLFGDWGRDTMIALPGLTLSTRRYEDAKSILRTFLAYEKDGLVPNLFPEGTQEPMYNTVDAALLLIDSVWQYTQRTGDTAFALEAYPVMARIIEGYKNGTHHGIKMDADGLIMAGRGLDQVTWMDVCVEGILPTPRHGKPVEINAYWYNALCIMERFAPLAGKDGAAYGALAQRVKVAFLKAFWMEEKGYLRDVITGTKADEQMRCNQIWTVTMPFGMLSPEQEVRVVDAVYRHLYTPCGLRTLSPEDKEYHPRYGGAQKERDMAYHQGTAWVFPLGAYYLAYLKTQGYTKAAAQRVRAQLEAMEPMLREGCAGQLPEIYDGGVPSEGKGCFAQAWSVGEMLRVYEKLEEIEHA
ncbi:MAG: glycogen debranching enzyme family protein [Clostridia bacterium]|nr:glycogen debranching enzyme family protein [Clostridia bacterium]